MRVDPVVSGLFGLCLAGTSLAAEPRAIEEIIVTAQRIEENAQRVPMAITAFTDAMIEDRRIIGIADLSLYVPNLSYNTNNVGDSHVTIRGVGSLVSVQDGESGVSLHVNEVPLSPGQPPLEIFDVKRIEVLRGPQGTLYGRNATGGVINLLTERPSFDGPSGYVDVEAGDYDLWRLRGAVNASFADTVAVRIAGLSLDRDGYTDNLAGGQVPGVPSDIDGRDLWAVRASAAWRITDETDVWLMYEHTDENDDRMLTHNRRCVTAVAPVTRAGCEPGVWGLGAQNPNQPRATTALSNGLRGVIPLGARDAETGLTFRYPRPEIDDLREVHIDLAPTYEFEQDLWQLGASHDFDWATVSFLGGYQDWELRTVRDSDWQVGHEMAAIPQNPSGFWPVATYPGGKNRLNHPVCNINEARGGVLGGCVLDPEMTREFWYGDGTESRDFYSAELRLHTHLEGRFNILVGANYMYSDDHDSGGGGSNNYWEMWTQYGIVGSSDPLNMPFALDLDPANRLMIMAVGEGKVELESYSMFSEAYVDLADHLKLTVAARYNWDEKKIKERGAGAAFDINTGLGGALGQDLWVRVPAALYVFGVSPDASLLELYGIRDEVDAAIAAGGPIAGAFAASQLPLVTAWNEGRITAGAPTSFDWDAWTGRLVLDWQASEDVLAYVSYARGYKPGGFNGPASTNTDYDREDVDSYEIGVKSLWADRSLLLNVVAFFNDYDGLQLSNLSLEQFTRNIENTNVEAEMYGAEIEARWRPAFAPRLELEASYGWLDTEVQNEAPRVDPLWLTNGDPAYVELFSFATNTGSGSGRYVARVEDVLPLVDAAIAAGAAIGPAEAPGAVYPNGIPGWFDGLFLLANGVDIEPGIFEPVSGNQIPDNPEHTVHAAASYTWDVLGGALTARWDYYWQSKIYLTIFNRSFESQPSWDQNNAALIYESGDGRWSARAWVHNIEDDVHVLGGYRQQSQQDFSVTDPRTYGFSLRYNFGAL